MPAGIKYDMNATAKQPEIARYDSVYRYSGGFNLDLTNLANGSWVPPFAPLVLDFATRKAYVVINVKVVEAAESSATTLKVQKGSLAYVGMKVGDGTNFTTVSAIDRTNAGYDALTVSALAAGVANGAILFEIDAYALTANVAADATTAKVTKGAKIKAGDTVIIGGVSTVVSAVDTSNSGYESLTITALGSAKSTGASVIVKGASKNNAKALNYSWVKVESGATLTAVLRAYEINREKEIAPITAADEESLGANFVFIN